MILCGDLEANGLLEVATKIHCGVFKDIQTNKLYKFTPANIDKMCEWLDKNASALIFHNGTGFDFPVMKKIYGWEYKGKKIDTLIMSRVLNPQRLLPPHCPNKRAGPHSIEAWGYRVGRGKPEYTDWDEYDEDMLHRCTEDVEILHLVFKKLCEDAKKANWKPALALSQELFENLQKQEEYGWKVDEPYMDFCIHQLQHWIDMIDKVIEPYLPAKVEQYGVEVKKPFKKNGELAKISTDWGYVKGQVGGPFTRIKFRKVDPNSNKEVKEMLLTWGWQPLEWNYDDEGNKRSAKMSKDEEFIGVNGKLGKLIARRVQCRQRKGILDGWKLLIRKDGTIPSIVAQLAATGRAMHRNIVNVPHAGSFFGKQMRKIFSSREHKILVGVDSDACQIRMLASRMNDDEYTESIRSGEKSKGTDMHSVNQRRAGLPTRDAAKTFFYAYLFGAGNAKLGKALSCSESEAGKIRERFDAGFPKLVQLRDRLTAEWRKTAKKSTGNWGDVRYSDGYITGLDGRPIRVPSEHQILVYLLQSDEAIYMTHVYNTICKELGHLCKPLCWYHDEVNVECSPENAEEVKQKMEVIFSRVGEELGINIEMPGNGLIGKNWFDIH